MKICRFDIETTNACKGIALILLLWHHLFYAETGYGFITIATAKLSKVCVAIFIILSGYGLSESMKSKRIGLIDFYKKRLIKIYLNYWLISALFVPIGIFFFGRTLDSVFNNHEYLKFALQLTGLHRWIYDEYGYNITWWYMSVIIPLYILFPFIFNLTNKFGLWFLFFCLILLLPIGINVGELNNWILPFALGIYFSRINGFVKLRSLFYKAGILRLFIMIFLIFIVALFRVYGIILTGTKIDWMFGGLIILLTFEITNYSIIIRKGLSFLGTHLFNIFLFHTFIYLYFWKDFIYSFKYPVLIFLVLLSTCIIVSLIIENLKKLLLFYKLESMICGIKIHEVNTI